jgi:hypothetical protein
VKHVEATVREDDTGAGFSVRGDAVC